MKTRILFYLSLLFSLTTTLFVCFLLWLVFASPNEHLNRDYIKQSLLTESTIYYQDGQNKLGTFFDKAHRNYLVLRDPVSVGLNVENTIPPLFLKALVASEDKAYYEHMGVSVTGVVRAIVKNLKAGRVVAGGSTLTMQTSEMLFEYRHNRSNSRYLNRLFEMLDAVRLEARYTKDEILEFYANLFHVHGTGQGLAIAARYYFDKEVQQLNLPELAFIAGSVKGPSNYNPFRTNDPERRQKIIQRATNRRDYVLNNMLEVGFITKEENGQAKSKPVQFNLGSFRFDTSHQVEAVRRTLKEEPIASVLEEQGVSNLASAEINVYTTLDYQLQRETEFSLKRQLSRLEYRIHGYVQPELKPLSANQSPESLEFAVGTVRSIQTTKPYFIEIQVGADMGRVEGELLEEWVKYIQKNRVWQVAPKHYREAWELLKVGDPIYVSVHRKAEAGHWQLGIEMEPQLNGAMFVLQEGRIRAFAGGFDNKGFNRALDARRQPGSTFKIITFLAAMELGWNALERLPNQRRVYPFQRQFYFPSPDHTPPDDYTSMLWAGTKSENLATIYLMYHLLDHLNPEQYHRLLHFTGLSHQANESADAFIIRLRDRMGIIDTPLHLSDGVFQRVKARLLREYSFSHFNLEQEHFDQLFYGNFYKQALNQRKNSQSQRAAREKALLKHNFLHFNALRKAVQGKFPQIAQAFAEDSPEAIQNLEDSLFEGLYIYPRAAGRFAVPPLAYSQTAEALSEEWKPLKKGNLLLYKRFWSTALQSQFLVTDNIFLEGKLRVSLVQTVDDLMHQKLEELKVHAPYSEARLFYHQDLRVMAGLWAIVKIAQQMGVRSPLNPVLSLPLGSNEVTLQDLALLFQTYMKGEIYHQQGQAAVNEAILIDRIENAEGKVLFQNRLQSKRVLPEATVQSLREILRTVVEYGTGRGAKSQLQIPVTSEVQDHIRLPGYGKTGTANNYTNATWAGFVPFLSGQAITMQNGYTITAYVGYDRFDTNDGQPPFKLTGSSGPLPAWADLAHDIINRPHYQANASRLVSAQSTQLAAASSTSLNELPSAETSLEEPSSTQSINPTKPEPLAVIPAVQAPRLVQQVSSTNGIPVDDPQRVQVPLAEVYLPPFDGEKDRSFSLFELFDR